MIKRLFDRIKGRLAAAAAVTSVALALATPVYAGKLESTAETTTYHRVQVDRTGVFYREAGPANAPTMVLLHGFPSSAREFDALILGVATKVMSNYTNHIVKTPLDGFMKGNEWQSPKAA